MEVLSPIPVVSYVDPKDKMFNTWFKMYISIYVEDNAGNGQIVQFVV